MYCMSVVDRHAGAYRATRRVDVQGDVAVGVLGSEQQQLAADAVGDIVVDLLAEEHDAVPQEALEHLLRQHGRSLRDSRQNPRWLVEIRRRGH